MAGTGTQMQPDSALEGWLQRIADEQTQQRQAMEALAREMRDTHGKIFARIARRDLDVERLKSDAHTLTLTVQGTDGEGGLKADVERLVAKLNVALGIGIALGTVGAFLGWCIERVAALMRTH